MREQQFSWEELSLGTCYYPEHWKKELWRDDLKRMKEVGIGTVRIAEFAWSIFEPAEGEFQFDFFDEFLDIAEEEQMQVIMGTPTSVPPVWLTERYPEVLNCRKDGVKYRHGMRRHFNYNSPKLLELASRIVEEVASHYAKRSCIVGWQIDNELNCEIAEYYSESDILRFREFLKEKYQTLDALNDAWGTVFWNQTYTEWNQVYVPRTTINDMVNPHQMLDYIRFISDSTIRFCKMQADILKKHIKDGDFITTNGMFGNVDNHKMMDEALTVYTYDSYPNFAKCVGQDPKHAADLSDRRWSMHLMDVRSICPHFGIMEQQSGANGWSSSTLAPAPKPGQMMLWTMQSVAHGADYVSFFRWRTATFGTEIYWHGILDYDNCDNRKLTEVAQIHKRMQGMKNLAGAEYIAKIGLVRDYDNNYDAQIDVWHGHIAYESELELFIAAQENHVPMDAVYLLDSTKIEKLQKYKVLFYPHAEILTEQNVKILEAYVRGGGILIIGARTGQKDVHGHCVMMHMPGLLAPLTQTIVKEYTLVGPGDEDVVMDWNGRKVSTGKFHDILAVNGADAKVLATYDGDYYAGEPALVETSVGDGRVLHFGGTFTRENVGELLSYVEEIEPCKKYVEAPAECEIALRVKGNETYLFVLNYTPNVVDITLKMSMTDVDTNQVVAGNVSLPAYGTKVYRIS